MNAVQFWKLILTVCLFQCTNAADREAYNEFGTCLEDNRDKLVVRHLKDIYRLRGIPKSCCSSLAKSVMPAAFLELGQFKQNKAQNCRMNAFFIPGGAFDPHNHPLYFVSVIVAGGYTHSYMQKRVVATVGVANDTCTVTCVSSLDEDCAEQNRIYRKDYVKPLEYHGTVKLRKIYKESFTAGDLIAYKGDQTIHTIDSYVFETLTVNWVSSLGDNVIDVFTLHRTPFRRVLTKVETQIPMRGPLADAIINKTIRVFE